MRTALVLVALNLVGCSISVKPPEDDPKTFYAKQNAIREANSERHRHEAEKRNEEKVSRLEKEEAERKAQTDTRRGQQKTEKADALRTSCEADRPAREAEMQKDLDARAHKEAFRVWENEHCQMVDRSKPVIKTVQDAKGEYHTFEGRDRAAGLECDTKRPEVFKESRAEWCPIYYIPPAVSEKNSECEQEDFKVSQIAKNYDAMAKASRRRR